MRILWFCPGVGRLSFGSIILPSGLTRKHDGERSDRRHRLLDLLSSKVRICPWHSLACAGRLLGWQVLG
ncbi:MAG: hypothetical protein C0467_33005 [Planctomycetaceae bacterium]|nr:hypothetical protein [Planctomycetaceae bacterium]